MERVRRPKGPGVGVVTALAGLVLLAAYCKNRSLPDGQCVFNSDCDGNAICAGRFCRAQCNPAGGQGDRDCVSMFGMGWHCRPSGQADKSVCTPPGDEGYCVYSSQCNDPLVCTRDGRCANQCVTDRDCVTISLDPTAQCSMAGYCSFRDGGVSGDASGDGGVGATDAAQGDVGDVGDGGAGDDGGADGGG